MGKYLKLWAFCGSLLLVCSCAGQKSETVAYYKPTPVLPVASESAQKDISRVPAPAHNPASGARVLNKAKSAIGTPYVFGGSAPGGFDCSGLVKWAYSSVGVTLPRTAREQAAVGTRINKVEDMRAGDIVAFRHPKRGYHTGIYVGDGKFVHSPRRRSTVRINSLSDPYFNSTLLGARRINVSSGQPLVAEAESRLEEYLNQKGQLNLNKSAAAKKSAIAKKSTVAAKAAKTKKSASNVVANAKVKKSAVTKNKKTAPAVAAKNKKTTPVAKNAKSKSGKIVAKATVKSKSTPKSSKSKASIAPAKKASVASVAKKRSSVNRRNS